MGKAARNERRENSTEEVNTGGLIIWVIVGIILVLAAATITVTVLRDSDDEASSPASKFETSSVVVTGAPLPQLSGEGEDAALGMTVPSVSGKNFQGETITIANDGKPKVIMVVAHWCPHCQREVPKIAAKLESGMPEDVSLYGVSTSVTPGQSEYPPSLWLMDAHWPVSTIADSPKNAAAAALGVSGFPYFLVVDKDGKVVQRTSGEISMETFDDLIEAARTGQQAPSA